MALFVLTLCSFAVLSQGKRTTHAVKSLEVKSDPWSIGEVVEWPKVQAELTSLMKTSVPSDTVQDFPKTTRTALEKLGSWVGGLFGGPNAMSREEKELRKALETSGECQIHGFLQDLIKACEAIGPQNTWEFNDFERVGPENPFKVLPWKTCVESAQDIFLFGEELVKMFAFPPEKVWENFDGKLQPAMPLEELKMLQSSWFLRNWFVQMASANTSTLLWEGFWEGDTSEQTTKSKLFQFAKDVDHQTVHPDTELGRLIEKHGDLNKCDNDSKVKKLTDNMWSFASMSFVLDMKGKGQTAVVALLNKDIGGPRSLKDSVLFQHEVPALGVAAWGTNEADKTSALWSPQFLLIDMKGTCDKTSKLLRNQLFAGLSSPTPSESHLAWTCINCPGQCDLDKNLANYVSKTLKAPCFKSSNKFWAVDCKNSFWMVFPRCWSLLTFLCSLILM